MKVTNLICTLFTRSPLQILNGRRRHYGARVAWRSLPFSGFLQTKTILKRRAHQDLLLLLRQIFLYIYLCVFNKNILTTHCLTTFSFGR
jgi:hypothetical protein